MKKLKKIMALSCAGIMAISCLPGCGKKNEDNGELNLFIWTEYVPESVIEDFEDEYGIKVNVSYFSSNEDMLSKVKAQSEGTYDIVQPSDYMVEYMISEGMLEKLDQDALTNLDNIGDTYLDPSYDPGNVYSVPYQGGVAAIGVNTSMIDLDVTSYDDLFNEALKNNLLVLDDYRAVIGMTERSMGYSMNETDPDKLAEVEKKLLSLKDNIKVFDSDSCKSRFAAGEVAVVYNWSAEIALAMEEDPDIKIVYPEEGAYVFYDNWAIPKGAKNYDNAMKFINYILEADVAQQIVEEFPYLCCNEAALDLMGEDYKSDEAKNPPTDILEKGELVKNLDTDTLAIYDAMWTKLKQ